MTAGAGPLAAGERSGRRDRAEARASSGRRRIPGVLSSFPAGEPETTIVDSKIEVAREFRGRRYGFEPAEIGAGAGRT